jgi:hypothetical protein
MRVLFHNTINQYYFSLQPFTAPTHPFLVRRIINFAPRCRYEYVPSKGLNGICTSLCGTMLFWVYRVMWKEFSKSCLSLAGHSSVCSITYFGYVFFVICNKYISVRLVAVLLWERRKQSKIWWSSLGLSAESNGWAVSQTSILRTKTEMVFETLVCSTLNHLTPLIARENFIILSRRESNKSQSKISFTKKLKADWTPDTLNTIQFCNLCLPFSSL